MKTRTLTLYEEEPYFSNAINSMAKKNWVLVSKKRVQQEFSSKTIVECTFSKKNVSHWGSEYESQTREEKMYPTRLYVLSPRGVAEGAKR